MPDTRGIQVAISNRRPVLTDDPEYDRLLLEAHAEDPSQLQPDERAYAETLLARPETATFRSQNDPAADRARLGMPEDAPYASTMGQVLNMGGGPTRDPRSEAERLQAVEAVRTRLASQSSVQQLNDSLDLQAGPRMGAPPPLARSTARISAAPASMWTVAGNSLMAPTSGVIRGLKTANVLDDTPTPIADQAALDERRFHPKSLLGGDTSRIGPPKESRFKEALRAGYWNMRGVGAGEEEPETTGTVLGDMLSDPGNWLEFGKAPVAMAAAMIGKPKKLVAAVKAAGTMRAARKAAGRLGDMTGSFAHAVDPAWRGILEDAFPVLDKYNKERGFLKPSQIVERLQSLEGTPQELITAAEQLAASRTGTKLKPAEVIETLAGGEYERGRVLRRVSATAAKQEKIPGAPLGISTRRQEKALVDTYVQRVLEGLNGRHWYEDSGKGIYFHAGDNPGRADQLGSALSVTSSESSVGANSGFGVKAHGQAAAGGRMNSGKYPNNMRSALEGVYSGNPADIGPKRDPFSQQLALGGGYSGQSSARAVHDIWQGEAFGFVNPDGTPLRRGFSKAEHQWMDDRMEEVIDILNKNKSGGFSDWDNARTQAAAWTGAKIRAGKVKPADAAKSFGDYFERYHLQTGRDAVPSAGLRHLEGLADAPMEVREEYANKLGNILYDTKGRENAAMGKSMLVGGQMQGPGLWVDKQGLHAHPGRQVIQVAGTAGSGAERVLDPASEALIKANEAEYGILMGQDAIAGTMLESKAKAAQRNMFDMPLATGTLAHKDAILQDPRVIDLLTRRQVYMVPSKDGVRVIKGEASEIETALHNKELERIADLGPERAEATAAETRRHDLATGEEFASITADLEKRFGSSKGTRGKNLGFYEVNPWDEPKGQMGQQYAKLIDQKDFPRLVENFNKTAPDVARQLNELDRVFSQKHGFPLNTAFMELREAIQTQGFDGIRAMATKYGLPLASVLLMAQTLGWTPEAQTSPDSVRQGQG